MRLSLFNNEDEPEVSMSPLIDCVFLLLIFFLVSTMTKVKIGIFRWIYLLRNLRLN